MDAFPLTPSEAIAAASLITTHVAEKKDLPAVAELLPRWRGWAERLRTWGEANIEPLGVADADTRADLIVEARQEAYETEMEAAGRPVPQMPTVDLVAALRASVEAAKARRAAGEHR